MIKLKIHKRKIYLLVLLIFLLIMIIVFTIPLSTKESYNITEVYNENYTVIEPREIKVADWIKEDIMVNESFEDTRYNQIDLKNEIYLSSCSDSVHFRNMDLAIPEWGKIYVMSYYGDFYFAGFQKGFFTRREIVTFNRTANKGHIYRIMKNDKVNINLTQGEYLPLELGYTIQVNKIDNNLKSSNRICSGGYSGHYVPEEGEEDSDGYNSGYGSCITNIEYYQGATLSLSDANIVEQWNAKNGSTLIYQRTLSGGETIPMIVVHVGSITNSTVNIDAIFQLSKNNVDTAGGMGAEIAVGIKNTDSRYGTFEIYTGFILNSSLRSEIGKLNQVFLGPSESTTLYFTTSQDIEDCRYYVQSISKVPIPENFTNFRLTNYSKRKTQYRNVTQYIDVIKTKPIEKNITKFKKKTIYEMFIEIIRLR